jgi:putative tricarboxylic transport membrane protein
VDAEVIELPRELLDKPHRPRGFARWTAELGVALVFIVAGTLIVNGSFEQGVGWTANGPESGYFPLRIGWLVVAVGVIQSGIAIAMAMRAQRHPSKREIYLQRDRIKPLLQVFVPTVAYIALVPWLGLYIASTLFIAGFMWWHGRYRWRALPTAIAIMAVLYLLLEVWFKVELYKGPLAEWLLELMAR